VLREIVEIGDLGTAEPRGAQRGGVERLDAIGRQGVPAARERRHAAEDRLGRLSRELLRRDHLHESRERLVGAVIGEAAAADALDDGAEHGVAPHQRPPRTLVFLLGECAGN